MSQKEPLVSVIMPFYNTPPAFMREAIESVLAQTYPHWELLLVDDGSTNADSSETALAYAAARPHQIIYLTHPGRANRGLGPSRQRALAQARGDLIAFLDADDLWLPAKLAEQVALLVTHPQVAMVYGRTKYWHSWQNSTLQDETPPSGVPANAILPPPELLILFVRQQIAIPCTCSILVRRDALNEGFEAGIQNFFYEDQMLYAKICLRRPVLVADVCWDYYRQHSGSGTQLVSDRRQELHLAYLTWLGDYLRRQGVKNATLWRALRQQMWLYSWPAWLPKRLHQPARLGKKWLLRLVSGRPSRTLQLRRPFGRSLVLAALFLLLYLLLAEVFFRVVPVCRVLDAPDLGSEHRQFEQQWARLEDYAAQQGAVKCIMIGDSTVMSNFAPEAFAGSYFQQTGEPIACYNFGVGAFTVVGLSTLAALLIQEYSPQLFIVGVEALNFTVAANEQGDADLSRVPWAHYKLGDFNVEGWLYEHSALYSAQIGPTAGG